MKNKLGLVIDISKSTKTTKPTKKPKTSKAKAPHKLPEGGVWRTIRGAKVYIHDGKVIAGAEGKLSDFDAREIGAIHQARSKKQSYDQLIFHGTQVKVGKERKIGTVVGETKTQWHINYGDNKVRKVPKKEVRRADAYRLKLEEKLDLATAGAPIMISDTGKPQVPDAKKLDTARKEMGVTSKTDLEAVGDMILRDTPFTSIKAPLLKRDEQGNPVKEPVLDDAGKQVMDIITGRPKERYVTYEADNATEDDLIRDHQGLLISEIVNPYAKRYGLDFIQREWRDKDGNPVDLYGDLVQTANLGFLHGLREFAQKAAQGNAPEVGILTHGLMRSRQYTSRQAQNIFMDVQVPQRMLAPLSILSATESLLEQELERKPTASELAERLKGNPTFNSIKIKSTPEIDGKTGKLTDGKTLTDPVAKIEALYRAKKMQNAIKLGGYTVGGGDDNKEIPVIDTLVGDSGADMRIKQAQAESEMKAERKTLRKEMRRVFKDLLDDREITLVAHRYGVGSARKRVLELDEVAQKMGISVPLAKKISAGAMKKLKNATPEQLQGLRQAYLHKALDGMDVLLKALFVVDLAKSLEGHGLGIMDLEPEFVRYAYGTVDEIQKSLDIPEFIGTYVTIAGSDRVKATIIEYILPDNVEDLVKSQYGKKADTVTRNNAIKAHVSKNTKKYSAMAKTQRSETEARYKGNSGGMSWSVRLLYENPGSCWITWHGSRILISGENGNIIFDRANPAHRAKAGIEDAELPDDYKDFVLEPDYGQEALKEDIDSKLKKFRGNYKMKNGQVVVNPKTKKPAFAGDGWLDTWVADNKENFANTPKNKILKQFPSGDFLMENPETGKKVVMKVELKDGGTDKARTHVTYAFDPDADERVNIGNWKEIARQLDLQLGKGQNAYEILRSNANTDGYPMLDVLSKEEYDKLYATTTAGAQENMVHKQFEDVTPTTHKIVERDPKTNRFTSKEVAYEGNRIYQANLGNGRVAKFEITSEGRFDDPVMQKLISPMSPIRDANDLFRAMKTAIGNEAWVTITPSKTDHVSHHVRIKYDGQGAPIVVGGAFDGYRFQDSSEVDSAEEKAHSLFRGGRPVRTGLKKTKNTKLPLAVGNEVRIRNPQDRRRWVDAKIVGKGRFGRGWVVELPPALAEQGVTFPNAATTMVFRDKDPNLKQKLTKLNIATEAPVIDVASDGLNIAVPKDIQDTFEANYGITLDEGGRADISPAQFMKLREQIGSFSLTRQAQDVVEDLYAQQYRAGLPDIDKLLKKYDPNVIQGYRDNSFLRTSNFYSSQVEGAEHLVTTKKAIAGHGMGTGKTLLGIASAMYVRDQAIKAGKTPGKTLIVSPASIRSEWLKEINRHTDVGAVVVGGSGEHGSKFGQEGLQSRVVSANKYRNNKHDEHFAVMSYDQFMKNPEKFANMGFQNIIIDEVHAFKTKDGTRNSKLKTVVGSFENVWGLSGTPMDNKVTDIFYLVDAITGGTHDLGSEKEFYDTYLYKEGGKITGMNEDKLEELGQKLAKYAHFRNGYHDRIRYVDPNTGENKVVNFPEVTGNPNRYHGQLQYMTDFETQVSDGRPLNVPKPKNKLEQQFYSDYARVEQESLSPAQRQALSDVATSGQDSNQPYLQGVQRLQQFCNAPASIDAYFEIKGSGKTQSKDFKYTVDKDGFKRYWKSDSQGGYAKHADGSPVLLPPMHHNNPKASMLKQTILNQLAEHNAEMERRTRHNKALKRGEKPLPIYTPKVVVTSKYDAFGAEVVANVFKELSKDTGLGYGEFTGTSPDRETDKTRFQNDPSVAFMVISDAGKEGIDLGNAHMLIHYDQDFNPNKMAQKSARELRSDSRLHAEREQRPNEVKLVSLVVPGTVEESIIRAQQRKIEDIEKVEYKARQAEGAVQDSDLANIRAGSPRRWSQKVKKSIPLVTTRLGGRK